MYLDDFNWCLFFGILGNFYLKYLLYIDIVGIVVSIVEIIVEDLYICYNMFYYLSNMILFVVGKMDFEVLMVFICEN